MTTSSHIFEDETEVMDLDKIISLESIDLGEDFCPVNIACPDANKIIVGESTARAVDILQNPGQLFLIQLPTFIPEIEKAEPEAEANLEALVAESKEALPEGTEGEYGTLCVHESGKLSLIVNGVRFFLESGSNLADLPHVSGSQSIVAIDPEYEQSFELGSVSHTFVATLDYEGCLAE